MLAPWPQCHDVSHAGVSSGGPALLQGGRDRRDPSRAPLAFESHTGVGVPLRPGPRGHPSVPAGTLPNGVS